MTKSHFCLHTSFTVILYIAFGPAQAVCETVAFAQTVACTTGNFARYKASLDADRIDPATYVRLTADSDAVALLKREVCYDYSIDGLNSGQRQLLASRIEAANRCVQREVAALNAEQFVRAIAYIKLEQGALATIRQILKVGQQREVHSHATKMIGETAFTTLTKAAGLTGKALESIEAIGLGGAAAHNFIGRVGVDVAKDLAEDVAVKEIDPFEALADAANYQFDNKFKDQFNQFGNMHECL